MTIARAKSACVLRVSTSDGKSVEITLEAGQSIEARDPEAMRALQAQLDVGALDAVEQRPAKIDHDIDTAPRIARPGASKERG